jgi:hypothetical protein
MILASIFIGPPGGGGDLVLPPVVEQNIASLKRHHPGLPHRLFSGDDISDFIEDKFPREVLDAYHALRPYAYKADLARYCILHELGGVYADLAFFFTSALPFDGKRPIVFRDLIFAGPWDTSNSVIVAPPRHKALARAIELVCANVKRSYYGSSYLCPTGPALFGKALAETCETEDLVTGAAAVLKQELLRKQLPDVALPAVVKCLFLDNNKRLMAVGRKQRNTRGLGGLGISNSDDYAVRWTNRDVYASNAARG